MPEFGKSPVHIIETKEPARTAQENAKPHAEMKIIANNAKKPTSNLGKRSSVIGISKSACMKCQPEICRRSRD